MGMKKKVRPKSYVAAAGGKPKTAANTKKAAFRADGGRKEAASLK